MEAAEELRRRGFFVLRALLSQAECARLLEHYRSHEGEEAKTPSLTDPALLELLRERLTPVLAGTPYAPSRVAGYFFAIERGVKHEWHRDHGTYYVNQSHQNLLIAWLALRKPHAPLSGVCVAPVDRVPEWETLGLRHGGASRVEEGVLCDDQTGERHSMGDLDKICATPELEAGDALLFRGDVFHRTQDEASDRIALSLRVVGKESTHTVTRRHWMQRCAVKRYYLLHVGEEMVAKIDALFEQKEEMTFCEFAKLLEEAGVTL
jgi:hypothetical protein